MKRDTAMEIIHNRYMALLTCTLTAAELFEDLVSTVMHASTVMRLGVHRSRVEYWVNEYLDT